MNQGDGCVDITGLGRRHRLNGNRIAASDGKGANPDLAGRVSVNYHHPVAHLLESAIFIPSFDFPQT